MTVATHYDAADLALFAMQLLQPEQHQAVAGHAAGCGFCRQELARVQGDLAAFAHTAELRSPASIVRERVLNQVAREKKIAPLESIAPISSLRTEEIERPQQKEGLSLIFSARDQDQTVPPLGRRDLIDTFDQEDIDENDLGQHALDQPEDPALRPRHVNELRDLPVSHHTSEQDEPSFRPRPANAPDTLLLRSHRRSGASRRSSDLDSAADGEVHPNSSDRRILSTTFLWTGWIVAAGLTIAGGKLYRERDRFNSVTAAQAKEIHRLKDDAVASRRLLDTLTEPSARQVLLSSTLSAAAQGRILYISTQGALVFLANNLESLEPAKIYELWLVPANGRDPIPAGVFRPDAKGNASVILPPLPRGIEAKAFGVTIEAEAGSQTPTMPILLAGN